MIIFTRNGLNHSIIVFYIVEVRSVCEDGAYCFIYHAGLGFGMRAKFKFKNNEYENKTENNQKFRTNN